MLLPDDSFENHRLPPLKQNMAGVPAKIEPKFHVNQTFRKIYVSSNTTLWDGHGMTWALERGATYNNLPETDVNVNVHNQE